MCGVHSVKLDKCKALRVSCTSILRQTDIHHLATACKCVSDPVVVDTSRKALLKKYITEFTTESNELQNNKCLNSCDDDTVGHFV